MAAPVNDDFELFPAQLDPAPTQLTLPPAYGSLDETTGDNPPIPQGPSPQRSTLHWAEEQGGDVYLRVENTVFCTHSLWLGANCQIFAGMWDGCTMTKRGIPQPEGSKNSEADPICLAGLSVKEFEIFLTFLSGSRSPNSLTIEEGVAVCKLARMYQHPWGETFAKELLHSDPRFSSVDLIHYGRWFDFRDWVREGFRALSRRSHLQAIGLSEQGRLGIDIGLRLHSVQRSICMLKATNLARPPPFLSAHAGRPAPAKGGSCLGVEAWNVVWSGLIVPYVVGHPEVEFDDIQSAILDVWEEVGGVQGLCKSCVDRTRDSVEAKQRFQLDQYELEALIEKEIDDLFAMGYEMWDVANSFRHP